MQSMLLMSVSRSHSVNCRINEFKCSHCKLICLRFRFLHASHSKNSETFFFKSFLGERYEWRARKCFLYTIFIHISLGIRDTSFALSFTPHSMSIMNNKISSNKTYTKFSLVPSFLPPLLSCYSLSLYFTSLMSLVIYSHESSSFFFCWWLTNCQRNLFGQHYDWAGFVVSMDKFPMKFYEIKL